MSMQGYIPFKDSVKFMNGKEEREFFVRGLDASDFTALLQKHGEHLDAGWTLARRAWAQYSTAHFDALVLLLCKEAPVLMSEIIALAADEPELSETYAKLPIGVQALALTKILPLTLEDAGGLKNLMTLLDLGNGLLSGSAALAAGEMEVAQDQTTPASNTSTGV